LQPARPPQVQQLCHNAWDEPHLAALLADAFAEQRGSGGSGASAGTPGSASAHASGDSSGGDGGGGSGGAAAAWARELPSLLQLRLQVLDALGAYCAYLELAMAGGAWREAINRLMTSKERCGAAAVRARVFVMGGGGRGCAAGW
jgi:hypothetical protein